MMRKLTEEAAASRPPAWRRRPRKRRAGGRQIAPRPRRTFASLDAAEVTDDFKPRSRHFRVSASSRTTAGGSGAMMGNHENY
jgi:hypothetical protein